MERYVPRKAKDMGSPLDEDKAVILKKPATSSSRPNLLECKPSSHMVNVHDTTLYDFIMANLHLLDYGEAP